MEATARAATRKIRVLIVDDSAFMRRAIDRLLEHQPEIEIVGHATNGVEGVQKALELRPDVITMDVEMPQLDGVSAVTEIMRAVPTSIIMLSTTTTEGASTTIRALEAGAIDCVAKPSSLSVDLQSVGERLCAAILRARDVRPRHIRALPRPLTATPARPEMPRLARPTGASGSITVIGSSTGGPPALTQVIPQLPADLPCGVLLVQHLPATFTGALARRLNDISHLNVREAVEGDVVSAGTVLVAPGDFHMTVDSRRVVHLNKAPALHGVRPAVDVTLDSVASVYGARATVAILTGMGKDGAAGAARVESAGGHIIVQDEATCVVWGMPKVTKEQTARAQELPIDRIAAAITRSASQKAAG
ncbi:MAG: chemotaxis response regulator protein-glutamate methylesterase [Dehalococcoidia bacterium]